MALQFQTFKTRTITAAVFVIVMLTGLFWNHWSFFVLFSIIHFGCFAEYQRLIGLIDDEYLDISVFHKYGVMAAGWCFLLYFTNDAFRIASISLHAIGWWLGLILVFVLPVIELLFAREVKPKNIAYSALGLVYISLSLGLMINLRTHGLVYENGSLVRDTGFILPCALIFSLWINDTMAYIVGSLIGKTPLSRISPKKTWEGTVGGMLLCIAVIGLLAWWSKWLPMQQALVIAAIAAVAGTIGDLLESKLKRMADVKDSGAIMPGHGGYLDRFDSLLFAIPFVWFYIALTEQLLP